MWCQDAPVDQTLLYDGDNAGSERVTRIKEVYTVLIS